MLYFPDSQGGIDGMPSNPPNAGMFFWRADVFVDVLRRYLPKTASLLAALPQLSSRQFPARLREMIDLEEEIGPEPDLDSPLSNDAPVKEVPS